MCAAEIHSCLTNSDTARITPNSQTQRIMDHSHFFCGRHGAIDGRVIFAGMVVQPQAFSTVRPGMSKNFCHTHTSDLIRFRNFAMAAAMFMNSNSLPIALMQSLVVTVPGLKWDKSDSKDAMVGRALTYLVLYSTLGMVVSLFLKVNMSI